MFKKILVATDGSAFSHKAADLAVRLAKAFGASLVAMTAETPITSPLFALDVSRQVEQALEQQTHQILSEVAEMAKAAELPCQVKRVVSSVPFQAILDAAAAEGCDLIVMGSHGRSGIEALVLGSVAQKVLAHAAIPVLVSR
jgi:nucleotide-binding universal stress UspA family protein